MSLFTPINLKKWADENRHLLQPPVSNKQVWKDERDTIVFVSGGPNTRNDFHVNPTEEFFYQLKGDIALRVRDPQTGRPQDIIIREGEMYLLPKWIPHRPQRPADTVGLILEFPRPPGELDSLRWYCEECDALVHEASWRLKSIDTDLKVIMEAFWSGPVEQRTCKRCGTVIEKARPFKMLQRAGR
jgi:3-hydroxyanthranilate 3,4-dioxygenase